MSTYLHKAEEKKKNRYINRLLNLGVYKTKNRQLYELSLQQLEQEYDKVTSKNP
ncbi:Fur-regulated basic protein FbpA [Terrilactibacillus sp. BCM23-1]|uniref:Fur-regulated basic protein FbpA n=1 Tax=Terrilactibacillus tamarindi TaxID=2599694 RepID=A0A6N8CRK2_9BACI|nr:Fur-regulated basic protein FbpA [Terrilactibacillus tamarindi]MTT30596.1 Fur-regulated basic protein FbpA [Terrilactibacillus tamarindi]